MDTEQAVDFEFICTNMPGAHFEQSTDLRLGIQRGKEVVDDVPGDADRAIFRFSLRVKENPRSGQRIFL